MLPDTAGALARHVDDLLHQHRAGINPTFGQLEDLRDWNERVKADLLTDDLHREKPSRPVEICKGFGCQQPRASYDAQYCHGCLARVAVLQAAFPFVPVARVDAFVQAGGRA